MSRSHVQEGSIRPRIVFIPGPDRRGQKKRQKPIRTLRVLEEGEVTEFIVEESVEKTLQILGLMKHKDLVRLQKLNSRESSYLSTYSTGVKSRILMSDYAVCKV